MNYNITVSAPKGSVVTVSPERLVFNKKYEKQNYTMTIKYKSNKKHGEHFGALAWVDDNGKYSVRNPIVITCFNC